MATDGGGNRRLQTLNDMRRCQFPSASWKDARLLMVAEVAEPLELFQQAREESNRSRMSGQPFMSVGESGSAADTWRTPSPQSSVQPERPAVFSGGIPNGAIQAAAT